MRVQMPSGIVALLFTDIQGSTALLQQLGSAYPKLLERHHRVLRQAFMAHEGLEVDHAGDGFFVAFSSPAAAVSAAIDAQRGLAAEPWPMGATVRVRMGIHAGLVEIQDGSYVGLAVHEAARIMSAGHGGQVLLSGTARDLLLTHEPPETSYVDVGEHRLKDLDHPVRLFQLAHPGLPSTFAPLRTINPGQGHVPMSGFPAPLSSFVGRKKEMGDLRRLFPHTRVLTLLGSGGCGKTRLAVEFARQQESRFADGSILVELAAVRDPAMVANAIAAAAGLTLSTEDTIAELSRRLRDKHLLAVVDNCEHLIDAVAAALTRLLGDCPRLSVLATSQERINIDGETSWRVPSLGLPEEGDDAESLASADSVRLFVDRARSRRPGFEVDALNGAAVAAICRRLDGVPLAIELAASRVTTLSPAEILPRLEDRFQLLTQGRRAAAERHQTLRAAIDWSYDLLDPSERTILQRLSIFAGPFSADAAQEICATPPVDGTAVPDVLQRLVDKSMVQADADPSGALRFRLLESIRDYAAEKLASDQSFEELADRHLAFYLQCAERGFEQYKYRGAIDVHASLWGDIGDLRAALDWSRRDPRREVALASSLFFLWVLYAPAEGLRRLVEAMGRLPYEVSVAYGRGAWAVGALAGRAGRPELLSPEEYIKLAEQLDDDFLRYQGLIARAFTAERRDRDLPTARAAFLQAVPEMEEHGLLPSLSFALSSVGSVEMQIGNLDAARPPLIRAIEIARAIDDGYNLLGAYFQLGWLDLECGVIQDARANFMAALELTPPGDLLSTAFQVEGLGCADVGVDDRRALTLFGAAERMRTEVDTVLSVPWVLRVEPDMARARAALPEAASEAAWHAGLAMQTADLVARLRSEWSPQPRSRNALPGGLSRRETEVAGMVAAGMTSKLIADRLFLAERTVESHVEHILTKLDFNTRAQIATWVTEQKIGE